MTIELFTIGYASFSIEDFVSTIRKYDITAIADVRSAPYSRYKPDFSKDKLQGHLTDSNISYLFLGNLLGARIKTPEVYQNGKLSYHLLSKSNFWKKGIKQLLDAAKNNHLAIMCAEKDPINCHRTFLICRSLRSYPVKIQHILEDGSLEDHVATERRLLEVSGFEQPDMFRSESDYLEEVYEQQCEQIIAYN